GPDEVGLRADELLGGAGPDADRAGQLLALHDLLHRERRGDVHRLAGVVAFAVSGRAFDHRLVPRDRRLLRRLRDAVDVRAERDHGLARSPRRHERGGNAGDAFLHREAVLLEDVDQVAVGLEFLEAELAVAEDLVDHLLRELRAAFDVGDRFLLQRVELRVAAGFCRRVLLRERRGDDEGRDDQGDERVSGHGAGLYPLRSGARRAACARRRPGCMKRAEAAVAIHEIGQDVRFSARLLARDRRFTCIAVLALALGIGANNTLFTVVNAICIRGLPFAGVDRLIDVSNRPGRGRPQPLSPRQFADLAGARPAAVESFAAYATRPATLRDDASPAERITVAYVSPNAFTLLGQRPSLGRVFGDDEDRAGAPPTVILSDRTWRTRYAADPNVIGRAVKIDGIAVSIVGVMPDGFRFPDNTDAWRPLAALTGPPDARALNVFGRLAAGATVTEARQRIAAVLAPTSMPPTGGEPATAVAVPLNDRYLGDISNPAWITFITVGLLIVVI